MNKLPISCFIISKNEADRIARTIRSIKSWVDEVVVVDSQSSDDTVRIALAEGCRVITQPWLGFGAQKRFAEDQCRNQWVLNLDADEVITPELQREIIALFEHGTPSKVAYAMPLELVYPGDERPRRWARDHMYVRLYDRHVVRFRDSHVHDAVVTGDNDVGILQAPAYHYSIRTYDDLKRKLAERMRLSAEHADPASPMLWARLAIELPVNFFKYYIVRYHFTGGFKGLRYAWIQASYRQTKVVHMWHARRARRGTLAPAVTPGDNTEVKARSNYQGGAMSSLSDFSLRANSQSSPEICAERA